MTTNEQARHKPIRRPSDSPPADGLAAQDEGLGVPRAAIPLELPVVEGETASRDELIRSHLGLVVSIAKRYCGRGASLMDLVSDGNTGLVRAASKFEPSRGVRFATYAYPWIEHAIRSACLRHGDVVSIPLGMKRLICAYRRLAAEKEPGCELSAGEVAARLGVPVELAAAVMTASSGLRSAPGQSSKSDLDPMKLLPARNESDPSRHIDSEDAAASLGIALESLSAKERKIIEMHFGLAGQQPRTRAAIAAELDMLSESIDWVINRALGRLRLAMRRQRVA